MAGIEVVWKSKDEIALRLSAPGREPAEIPMDPESARLIGRALIVAGVASESDPPPVKVGEVIQQGDLHVMRHLTGVQKTNGEPILRLTVAGGLTLSFQMPGPTAEACGKSLQEAGEKARPQGRPS